MARLHSPIHGKTRRASYVFATLGAVNKERKRVEHTAKDADPAAAENRLCEPSQTVMLFEKLTAQGQSVIVYFYNLGAYAHVGEMPDLDFAL